MRALMRKIKSQFTGLTKTVVVGTHALKEQLETFLQADYWAPRLSLDRFYGLPCEFHDTQLEAFHAMMHHRELGRTVLYAGDDRRIIQLGPMTVSAMVNGQWQELGKILSPPVLISTKASGLSRNAWKRIVKKRALAQRYAEKIHNRNHSQFVVAERQKILQRWNVADSDYNIAVSFSVPEFEMRMPYYALFMDVVV